MILRDKITEYEYVDQQTQKIIDYSNYLAVQLDETITKLDKTTEVMSCLEDYCDFLRDKKDDPSFQEFVNNKDVYVRQQSIEEVEE